MVISSTISASDGVEAIVNQGPAEFSNVLVRGGCINDVDMTSNGYNIESPEDTCGFDQLTDQTPAQLNLGPLQDNGGPTQTHALGAGSVAIDQIPLDACLDADGELLTTDQRGIERPQGDACDVGAVEMQVTP